MERFEEYSAHTYVLVECSDREFARRVVTRAVDFIENEIAAEEAKDGFSVRPSTTRIA